MREILFRGKINRTKWVYGDLIHDESRNRVYIWSKNPFAPGGIMENIVDPETVGQFTGLLDKNGKKIFEDDIMRNAGNVVEFYGDGFCINGDSSLSLWTKTEIIGNIHDNPELLKW